MDYAAIDSTCIVECVVNDMEGFDPKPYINDE